MLTLWTDEPALAASADAAGVDRIGLDLEKEGKRERQQGGAYWISEHADERLAEVARALSRARLFVRVNPPGPLLASQVEQVLAAGAQVLMLPMFRHEREAASFVELVGGRAEVVLLLENADAMRRIEAIVRLEGIAEVHIGLNDLALSLGLPNRFAAVADGTVDRLAAVIHHAGLPLGVGGIGRAGDDRLPVPSDLVYAEQARLRTSRALLSRAFAASGAAVSNEVARARERLAWWADRDEHELAEAHREFGARVRAWTEM